MIVINTASCQSVLLRVRQPGELVTPHCRVLDGPPHLHKSKEDVSLAGWPAGRLAEDE